MIGVDDESLANIAENKTIPDDAASMNPRPAMNGMDQSYAASNEWYCYLPIEDVLGKRYKNLELHLTKFSIPQIEIGSMDVAYKGYTKTVPTGVLNAGPKQLTLNYLVDEYWQNYKSLYAWVQSYVNVINPMTDDKANGVHASSFIPMRIYLMNNYKQKILEFVYSNVWIIVYNELQLDVANQDQIEHSFTICYDDFRLAEI